MLQVVELYLVDLVVEEEVVVLMTMTTNLGELLLEVEVVEVQVYHLAVVERWFNGTNGGNGGSGADNGETAGEGGGGGNNGNEAFGGGWW